MTFWHDRRRRTAVLVALLAVLGIAFAIEARRDGRVAHDRRAETQAQRANTFLGARSAARARLDAAVQDARMRTPVIRFAGGGRRSVALTFDDGPGPQTPAILDALAAGRAHATFFTLGARMAGREELLRRIVAGGNEIGDHTWSHADLARLRRADQRAEIRSQAFLTVRGGLPRPRLLRPPYGSYDRTTRAIATRERMLIVLWSDDPQDYELTSARALRRAVLAAVQPGAIVLLHDGPGPRATTSRALPSIIRSLHRRGYRLVTVSELVAGSRPPARQGLRGRRG